MIKSVMIIIGISVNSGATATLIPPALLCLSVSETTSARSGPGDTPAVKPRIMPESRKERLCGIKIIIQSINYNDAPVDQLLY